MDVDEFWWDVGWGMVEWRGAASGSTQDENNALVVIITTTVKTTCSPQKKTEKNWREKHLEGLRRGWGWGVEWVGAGHLYSLWVAAYSVFFLGGGGQYIVMTVCYFIVSVRKRGLLNMSWSDEHKHDMTGVVILIETRVLIRLTGPVLSTQMNLQRVFFFPLWQVFNGGQRNRLKPAWLSPLARAMCSGMPVDRVSLSKGDLSTGCILSWALRGWAQDLMERSTRKQQPCSHSFIPSFLKLSSFRPSTFISLFLSIPSR